MTPTRIEKDVYAYVALRGPVDCVALVKSLSRYWGAAAVEDAVRAMTQLFGILDLNFGRVSLAAVKHA